MSAASRLVRYSSALRPLSTSTLTRVPSYPITRFTIRTMASATEYKLKGVTSIDLKPGDKQEVEVEGIDEGKVLLLNAGGTVQAVGSKCTHYGAPLVKGVLTTEGRLVCPWHGACFNAKTGDVEDAPALDALRTFKVTQKDGAVYITGEKEHIKAGRRQPNFKCKAAADPSAEGVVVVGGGAGATGAIEGLRENGFTGPITMISNEGYLPIDRTKLSKALITDASKVQLRDQAFFDSGSVKTVQDEVTSVNFADKTLQTKKGEKYSYSKLILATGGTAKKLPLPGFKVLENIFVLRNIHDVKQIVDAIGDKGKKIVIVGSSFIGMEAANATASDNDVTVVGMEDTPLQRVLGDKVGAALQKGLEGKGVKFRMAAGVEKAEPSNSDPKKVGSVYLKDGTKLDADLVILGIGVSPATEFLKDNSIIKLEEDGSLKTDENFAVVGLKDVYALGDIATYPYHGPGGNGKPVRIEHWDVSMNSGRTAAGHIVAPTKKQRFFTPVFWSALNAQLRYCGHTPGGFDDLVVQGSLEENKWAAFYTQGDAVVAVASMGMDPVMSQSAELMALGKMPGKSKLESGFDVLSIGAPA